jgi:hypothetical protein
MAASGAVAWLERTAIASALREGAWLYPAVETAHILAVATLFGSVLLLDLRILGASRPVPLAALARHALRPVYAALPVIVATGSLMFVADASSLSANPAFRTKMALVPLALVNGLAFERRWLRPLRDDPRATLPAAAKIAAAASLALWIAVLVCGRLIAYV